MTIRDLIESAHAPNLRDPHLPKPLCSACKTEMDADGRSCPTCGRSLCWRCLERTDRREIVDHLTACGRRGGRHA